MDAMTIIQNSGVIPVLGLKDPETAPRLAQALKEGGLPLLEITMRAPKAMDCLKAIKEADPEMLVGAGTILRVEQADQAKAAGADFIVTPGFNPQVVTHCQELGLPVVPGCVTPTEIEAGLALGLTTFKFFPSEALGGMANIKQLCGPYSNIQFIPTAGITLSNMQDYLISDKIAAVGGSFMAPSALVDAQDWDAITALCRTAAEKSLGFSLAHVGVNCANEGEAEQTAKTLCALFGLEYKAGSSSIFAGSAVECMKAPYLGKNGHIAIATNSLDRAVYHLGRQGVEFDESTRKPKAIYLKQEVGGFAIHLVQK